MQKQLQKQQHNSKSRGKKVV